VIHFEWATKWLKGQNCKLLLPKLRAFGYQVLDKGKIVTDDWLHTTILDLEAHQLGIAS